LRLTTGIMPGPMPAFADALSADARGDLANFVVSLARTPPWEKGGGFGGAGFAADLSQRGNYLTAGRCAAFATRRSTEPGFTTLRVVRP
jgi:hypothetical protein